MQLTLRTTYLMVCILALAACSSTPTPEPSPTPEPVAVVKPLVIDFVQPQSVTARHHWQQRTHLHAHVHEAKVALSEMETVVDRTIPVTIVESQSHQLLIGGGEDMTEYQHMLAVYTSINTSQTATWHNELPLEQFSLLVDWQVKDLINQRDLDYALLQEMIRNYLMDSLAAYPFAYELAVSIAHEKDDHTSVLIIDGAADPEHSAELQARLLAALHDLSVANDSSLGLYSGEFLRPALAARSGPLVRFILRPVN